MRRGVRCAIDGPDSTGAAEAGRTSGADPGRRLSAAAVCGADHGNIAAPSIICCADSQPPAGSRPPGLSCCSDIVAAAAAATSSALASGRCTSCPASIFDILSSTCSITRDTSSRTALVSTDTNDASLASEWHEPRRSRSTPFVTTAITLRSLAPGGGRPRCSTISCSPSVLSLQHRRCTRSRSTNVSSFSLNVLE